MKNQRAGCQGDAMTDTRGSLHIEVVDGEIVVTAPFTSYTVTYYKLAKSPQLLAKRIASRDDPSSAMTLSEFLARAWKAANEKAREPGWIV
jgi:predicted alpha/beta hydrolase family esterase